MAGVGWQAGERHSVAQFPLPTVGRIGRLALAESPIRER